MMATSLVPAWNCSFSRRFTCRRGRGGGVGGARRKGGGDVPEPNEIGPNSQGILGNGGGAAAGRRPGSALHQDGLSPSSTTVSPNLPLPSFPATLFPPPPNIHTHAPPPLLPSPRPCCSRGCAARTSSRRPPAPPCACCGPSSPPQRPDRPAAESGRPGGGSGEYVCGGGGGGVGWGHRLGIAWVGRVCVRVCVCVCVCVCKCVCANLCVQVCVYVRHPPHHATAGTAAYTFPPVLLGLWYPSFMHPHPQTPVAPLPH